MGGQDPQVAKFTATALAAMDDDALASLANKGLVRRARKDLEKQKPALIGADGDDAVMLEVEGNRVRLAAPLARSTCACASGTCRHILAAIMFLRDTTAAAPAAPSSGPTPQKTGEGAAAAAAILALDEDALHRWAGKPLLKKAAVALARGAEIDEAPAAVVVRLPAQNVNVRFLGGGLDALLCSCHAPGPCEHKVAAVLAYRAAKGGRAVEVPQAMLEAAAGAARTREEVRESVRRTLAEMLSLGTSRLSAATEQRLRTLAVSAHGVDLPRLERALKSLADDVSNILRREARASSAAVLAGAARTAALVAALQRPTPAVVGEHRGTYLPVAGTAEVVGLGAARWRTRSGYWGLTVYFWEPAAKRWTGWTDARPLGTPGFDPLSRFEQDGPWAGAAAPRQAAMTKWRVAGAYRNAAGRIASRANTRGIPSGKSAPADGPAVADFAQLAAVADTAFAPGLAEPRDLSNLVLLAPAAWGEAAYDDVRQEVTRPVLDAAGRILPLALRHGPDTEHALTTLQRAEAAALRAVLGFLRLGPGGLFVEPVTLWAESKPIHLTLDDAPAASAVPVHAAPSQQEQRDEESEPADDVDAAPIEHGDRSGLGHLLSAVEAEVLAVAEGGVTVIRDLSPLRSSARHLRSAGVATLAATIDRLCDDLERLRKSVSGNESSAAEGLMRCAFAVQLAFDCDTLAGATPPAGAPVTDPS